MLIGPMRGKRNVATALSGVYVGGVDVTGANDFGTWRGTPVGILHSFPYKGTWTGIEQCTDAAAAQGTPYANTKLLLSIGMIPNSGGTLPDGAAGLYDSHWTNLAHTLVNTGNASCWIRPGWEFNNNSPLWSINPSAPNSGGVNQTANYKAYWIRIVNAMRAAGFTGKFIFCPANGTNSTLPDPALAYPGNAYVDAIMPDQYDKWYNHPGQTPAARWNNILYGLNSGDGTPRGLAFWSGFAKSHGKSYGFAEWGLWDPNSTSNGVSQGGGGDDVYYIDQVAAHLASMRSQGVNTIELYFNSDAPDGLHQIYPVGGFSFTKAAAEYKLKF